MPETLETFFSIRGNPNSERVGFEETLERPLHRAAVLNDQNRFHKLDSGLRVYFGRAVKKQLDLKLLTSTIVDHGQLASRR
jgi:hypothetical protein